jgi:DNA-binding CsgD family transcriptional regulator
MASAGTRKSGSLTAREREILGLLARGQSGAEIAAALVLSPETVRTHVRNAMAKLGASTRSQAVVMAMRAGYLADTPAPNGDEPGGKPDMARLLESLAGLHDVESVVAYLSDEDGLSLQIVAASGEPQDLPPAVALGDGPLGRVALERRPQLLPVPASSGRTRGSLIAAPIVGGGHLVGILGLGARASRPVGRGEMLLVGAFANRLGEIVAAGGASSDERLKRAVQRFRASWTATTAT